MINALVVMTLLAAAPASAEQSSAAAEKNARFGALRAQSDPYKKLFDAREDVRLALEHKLAEPKPATKPTVVCGMTVIPGDPRIDPKMAIPRQSGGIDYRLRTLDPPICNPTR